MALTKEEIKEWADQSGSIRFKEVIWSLKPRDRAAIEMLEFLQEKHPEIITVEDVMNTLNDAQLWMKFLACSDKGNKVVKGEGSKDV